MSATLQRPPNTESPLMAAPSIVPGETRIGWIGTGVMGASMVSHLIDAGFQAHRIEHEHQILGYYVAAGARRKGAAAQSTQ